MSSDKVIFWFRRDLRLNDNHGLYRALSENPCVQPIFIFDDNILNKLPKNDKRVSFIWEQLEKINKILEEHNAHLKIFKGNPADIFLEILQKHQPKKIYSNRDYEPYALERDSKIIEICKAKGVEFIQTKDHVIFEAQEILKEDGKPYTVYTPYKNKWLKFFDKNLIRSYPSLDFLRNLNQIAAQPMVWQMLGFDFNKPIIPNFDENLVVDYDKGRDFPSIPTTHLGTHLRFGTYSTREIVKIASEKNQTFLSELIWREFFIQILYYFPYVVNQSFRKQYDLVEWRNNEEEFYLWTIGKTGYPIVDAGMRELNETGFMHNRVRMICGSFLCKHLLIDWRWGEQYFAEKLLDFELASNNGNWQWVAGTGCDAAPYFRVFNPTTQTEKFDPKLEYIKKWVPEYMELNYQKPIVEHKFARERAIETYKKTLK